MDWAKLRGESWEPECSQATWIRLCCLSIYAVYNTYIPTMFPGKVMNEKNEGWNQTIRETNVEYFALATAKSGICHAKSSQSHDSQHTLETYIVTFACHDVTHTFLVWKLLLSMTSHMFKRATRSYMPDKWSRSSGFSFALFSRLSWCFLQVEFVLFLH